MARPAVPVIFPKGEARLGDVLDSLPNGEKPARPNKSLTVAEHLYAKEFSDDHGFTDEGPEGAARRANMRQAVSISDALNETVSSVQ